MNLTSIVALISAFSFSLIFANTSSLSTGRSPIRYIVRVTASDVSGFPACAPDAGAETEAACAGALDAGAPVQPLRMPSPIVSAARNAQKRVFFLIDRSSLFYSKFLRIFSVPPVIPLPLRW